MQTLLDLHMVSSLCYHYLVQKWKCTCIQESSICNTTIFPNARRFTTCHICVWEPQKYFTNSLKNGFQQPFLFQRGGSQPNKYHWISSIWTKWLGLFTEWDRGNRRLDSGMTFRLGLRSFVPSSLLKLNTMEVSYPTILRFIWTFDLVCVWCPPFESWHKLSPLQYTIGRRMRGPLYELTANT